MRTVKIDLIPERKAKTVYTMEMDEVEVIVIKAALKDYIINRTKFFNRLSPPIPTKGDAYIELANELWSSLPATGE
jgi:hypothetical protein